MGKRIRKRRQDLYFRFHETLNALSWIAGISLPSLALLNDICIHLYISYLTKLHAAIDVISKLSLTSIQKGVLLLCETRN